ncbi:MAG: hypothetical protein VKK04_15840 [Synechococcales bacterium]|nr:hypothetical protein [Synechococcales bacterium]
MVDQSNLGPDSEQSHPGQPQSNNQASNPLEPDWRSRLDPVFFQDSLDSGELRRLGLFLYLIPVVGFFPALWTLYRHQGDRQQRAVSRLAVTLALGWLLGYLLLNTGAQASDTLALPLLIISSLLTSGYFLVNIGLMVQLWRRKRLWLPGVSRLGDRLP